MFFTSSAIVAFTELSIAQRFVHCSALSASPTLPEQIKWPPTFLGSRRNPKFPLEQNKLDENIKSFCIRSVRKPYIFVFLLENILIESLS